MRCDRQSPCSNCVKANAQCVPVAHPKQRRRRFPERDLLERLRRYEVLLRENEIEFDPLHPDGSVPESSPKPSQHEVHDNASANGDHAAPPGNLASGKVEAV